MTDPIVSIVTPSFNQGPFIRATIESVLSQNYPNLEYIVMDGGSTDETASIVKDYASRLTWISEKDRGQSHAINKGFRMARGDIVSWLNSDDIILPGAVRTAVQAFREHPDAGAVYGEGFCLDRDGTVTGRYRWTEPFNLWKLIYLSDYILQQSAYFRRTVLYEVGLLNEDLHYTMDWDLFVRIALQRHIHYIPEYLGCIREYPEAKSFSGGAIRIREIRQMLRKQTGMLFPPGYITYGLETYKQIWCDWIERHTPPGLGKTARAVLRIACNLLIERASHAQGWHADGSIDATVKLMVSPPRGKAIILEGEVRRSPRKLTMAIKGHRSSVLLLAQGPFRHVLQVPASMQSRPIHLRIRNGWNPFRGDKCVRLTSVRFEDTNGTDSSGNRTAPPALAAHPLS